MKFNFIITGLAVHPCVRIPPARKESARKKKRPKTTKGERKGVTSRSI